MAGFLIGVTVVLHLAALLYIGLGGYLAWIWPKTIFLHVFFAVWGVAVNTLPLNCPFTEVENYFRGLKGLGPLPGGFNEYYVYGHIIPRPLLPAVVVVAVILLVVSYVGVYVRWRHSRPTVPVA
jgi:Protein of Unknown function (DUF2784)